MVVVVVVWVDQRQWMAAFVGISGLWLGFVSISGLWLGSSASVGGLRGFRGGGCGCCHRSASDPRRLSKCLLTDRVGFW